MPGAELARCLSVAGGSRGTESRDARLGLVDVAPDFVDDFLRFPPAARRNPEDCWESPSVLESWGLLRLFDGVPLLYIWVESSSSGDVGVELCVLGIGESDPDAVVMDDPVLETDFLLPKDDLLAWKRCSRRGGGGLRGLHHIRHDHPIDRGSSSWGNTSTFAFLVAPVSTGRAQGSSG